MNSVTPTRRTLRSGLVGMAILLSACAGGDPLGPTGPLDFDDPVPPARTPGSVPPGKFDEGQGGAERWPTHCALVYADPGFGGESTPVEDGAFAVELDAPGSVVVAPGCTLTLDDAQVETGYRPDGSMLAGAASCACTGPVKVLAYLVDVDSGDGAVPLYAAEPVDLGPLGWSERAGAIEFATPMAVATIVSDVDETGPAGDRVRPAAIALPEADQDGDGAIDLRWELFHSVPVRGPDNMLPAPLGIIEVNATDDRAVGHVECEPGECRAMPAAEPLL